MKEYKNVREYLEYVLYGNVVDVNSGTYSISFTLLTLMNKNEELDLTRICKEASVVKSTVVKFCKDIGYSGFIAVKEAINLQEARYFKNANKLENKLTIIDEFNQKIALDIIEIKKYEENIKWLVDNIGKFDDIWIVFSDENLSLARKLYNQLLFLEFNVKLPSGRTKLNVDKLISDKSIVIAIYSSQLQDFDLRTWNKIKNNNHFVISSESQITKLEGVNKNVTIHYASILSWFHSRNLIFSYVIDLIIYYISHTNSHLYNKLYSPNT